jgi:hypothetical protein
LDEFWRGAGREIATTLSGAPAEDSWEIKKLI